MRRLLTVTRVVAVVVAAVVVGASPSHEALVAPTSTTAPTLNHDGMTVAGQARATPASGIEPMVDVQEVPSAAARYLYDDSVKFAPAITRSSGSHDRSSVLDRPVAEASGLPVPSSGEVPAPQAAVGLADDVPAFARSQYGRVPTAERAAALERAPTCPYCGTKPVELG